MEHGVRPDVQPLCTGLVEAGTPRITSSRLLQIVYSQWRRNENVPSFFEHFVAGVENLQKMFIDQRQWIVVATSQLPQ
jgi:hypothetical protein